MLRMANELLVYSVHAYAIVYEIKKFSLKVVMTMYEWRI